MGLPEGLASPPASSALPLRVAEASRTEAKAARLLLARSRTEAPEPLLLLASSSGPEAEAPAALERHGAREAYLKTTGESISALALIPPLSVGSRHPHSLNFRAFHRCGLGPGSGPGEIRESERRRRAERDLVWLERSG